MLVRQGQVGKTEFRHRLMRRRRGQSVSTAVAARRKRRSKQVFGLKEAPFPRRGAALGGAVVPVVPLRFTTG